MARRKNNKIVRFPGVEVAKPERLCSTPAFIFSLIMTIASFALFLAMLWWVINGVSKPLVIRAAALVATGILFDLLFVRHQYLASLWSRRR